MFDLGPESLIAFCGFCGELIYCDTHYSFLPLRKSFVKPCYPRKLGMISLANSSSERVDFLGSMPASWVLMMKWVH